MKKTSFILELIKKIYFLLFQKLQNPKSKALSYLRSHGSCTETSHST